ncbi:MAG: hypothetical protein ACR2GH_22085 [Pseudonocardia sp.]
MSSRSGLDHTWLVVGLVLVTMLAGGGISMAMNGGWSVLTTEAASAPESAVPAGGVPSGPVEDADVPGTALVQLAGAAVGDPSADSVVVLLDRHFGAINRRDYATWATTVSARRAADQSPQTWQDAYRSTLDGMVVVTSITPNISGLIVDLSFVSEQDPSDAPPDLPVARICWSSHWPVEDLAASGRIGTPSKGATHRWAC